MNGRARGLTVGAVLGAVVALVVCLVGFGTAGAQEQSSPTRQGGLALPRAVAPLTTGAAPSSTTDPTAADPDWDADEASPATTPAVTTPAVTTPAASAPEPTTEPTAEHQAATTSAPTSAAAAPAYPNGVAGTPCTATARACVDVAGRKAWLMDGGQVVRGPVSVQTGDDEDPTPRGTFAVQWKAEQYTSREYLVQMPYSVFFAPGGVAFHQGRQDTPSAGCVKLVEEDAKAFFAYLQVGDEVQVT